ncbi:tetratricopeptide repeat protein [Propionispora hippei]|uniref:Tetratricopeptide repeat-containing protein n=1 Tax=Propionispora hippei DSM 15287 TaxID=1123003 RepID=A0A1M6DVV5_9FIRM|nr:tetratricopeptide repeat protein [Propionispora hippei]SHI77351.1 hypothetical protein SAMN02745170_01020 [Propionispora hippei DSM 15287]
MFFFRKKEAKPADFTATVKKVDPALSGQVAELKQQLETAGGARRLELLNELGGKLFVLKQTDEAIHYYEMSIQKNRTLGKAYTDLLKLYNVKRREAAERNDDEQLQQYLDKIDALMKLSKDVIRGLE